MMCPMKGQWEAILSVTYSADIWDGRKTHDSLGIATASTEAEAIEKAKAWAKDRSSNLDCAWLRVNIDGGFALGCRWPSSRAKRRHPKDPSGARCSR